MIQSVSVTRRARSSSSSARATASRSARRPSAPSPDGIVDRLLRAVRAELLASFHAATLPTGYLQRLFAARDMHREGIRLAAAYARSLLEVPGVGGVVIAGGVRDGDEQAYARALATVAADLGGGGT